MDYGKLTLEELRNDLIRTARKGYPIFLAGALFWLVMAVLSFFLEGKPLALCYVLGMGSIFPLGLLFSKALGVDFLSVRNPLSTLGGIIGGIQAFFLPVWIVTYIEQYELIPMMVGILGGSHFLPYAWIYRSRSYLFLTIATTLCSFVFGYVLAERAFLLVPATVCIVYLLTVAGLLYETRRTPGRPAASSPLAGK
ncbi:hypothetical protein J31TS4_11100 [Paenibacillus sp. J31TS4]|uniref:DUF7010 family protein n=1 Tax=Paenibacillus sp. J31TS4 TaxID=2807195 RepID=UPI001AFEA8CE|nr:hypothetical protein [Paenibacillus sp. J31TS4]GIP37830.1 hypothetical protein J31TS4_11100 [Paenibacillus sp. J31TS4]